MFNVIVHFFRTRVEKRYYINSVSRVERLHMIYSTKRDSQQDLNMTYICQISVEEG